MTWTQRQRDAIDRAIQRGVLGVSFSSRHVVYQTVAGMKFALWELAKYPEWGRMLPPGERPSWKRGTWA